MIPALSLINSANFALLAQVPAPVGVRNDVNLDDLYPDKPYSGRVAGGASWSKDDRYLAYLWNPYDTKGGDLWVYDTVTKKSQRVTSVDMFAHFDRDTKKVAERYKKDADEKAKRDKMTEDEGKKYDEEQKKKKDADKGKPAPQEYGGVSEYEWSHTGDQILLTYKGDVYRIKLGDSMPTRLTRTDEPELNVQWTKADDGYFFRRGDYVFRMKFDNSMVEQLNPKLPNGMTMGFYLISPDETKLEIGCGRSTGPDRQVTYISYRGRFAQALQTDRGVADDQFNEDSYIYLYDLNDDVDKNPDNDGKPWEAYHWPGGKEYGETAFSENPWTADSKKFLFTTWKRDKKEFQVMVSDVATKKTEAVYTENIDEGSTGPSRARPMWMPDGKILVNTEKSGFMQLWEIDPANKATRMVTKGDFEVEPSKLTDTGCIVTADAKDHARVGIYRATLLEGALMPIATRDGNYDPPVVSDDGKMTAAVFRSWNDLPELEVINSDGTETKITDSHDSKKFWSYQKVKPQLFSFQNRHGQTVHGYMYLPPDYKKGDHRPLWMYTYGGPLGSRGRDVKDGTFNNFNMLMAYKYGYISCTVDPRGVSGYGGAWEASNWEKPGVAQVEDLSDAAKWFMKEYGCDPTKIGINGWSFGGFQTQMCMYTAPDIFTLGIAGAGPTEWQNYNTWYTGGVIGYSHLGKPEDLDKFSLTKLAKNLKSPMMLLHGMEDTNVLFQDTVHVYQALLQAGKGPLIELVLDPTGSHGLGGDIKTIDRYKIYESYIYRHWGAYQPPKKK